MKIVKKDFEHEAPSEEVKPVSEERIIIKNLVLLAKTDNYEIHDIPLSKQQQMYILNVLMASTEGNSVRISKNALEGISWESEIDLNVIDELPKV